MNQNTGAPARTVVITGASGHLGRAVAAAFAAEGCRRVLIDRGHHSMPESALVTDPDVMQISADLLVQEQVTRAMSDAKARYGRVDVLCNLAGGFRMGEPVHETSDATWAFLHDINARTVLNTSRAVVPHMLAQRGGKIINVGAFAAQRGVAHMGAYIASKSAVIRLTETMSAELRDRGININCVLPTILDTPENRAAMPDADPSRWVSTDALAAVIVFLASDAARAVHGAALPVTGLS
ncbi:MAG: SDR family NAD(P)-dependent oxidoreductase [Pseudomonadota bacterium]